MAPSVLRLGDSTFSYVVLVLLSFFSLTEATVYNTSFPGVAWDNDDWVLTTVQPDPGHYESRGNLANGYIGINVASLGPFFEVDVPVGKDNINGWPLFDRRQSFATVAGFYDVQATTNGTNFDWLNQLGGESVISGIPHWSGILLEVNGNVLDATTNTSQISNYVSSLDMRNGLITWSYTWTVPELTAFDVEYTLFLHKLYINHAVTQLKITAHDNAKINAIDALHGDCAVRSFATEKHYESNSSTIWTAVQPDNIPYVAAYTYSTLVGDDSLLQNSRKVVSDPRYVGTNASGIAQQVTLDLKANQCKTIEKYVGIASSDAFDDPQSVAKEASLQGSSAGFASLQHSHSNEWHTVLTLDAVDNYTDPHTNMLPPDPNILRAQILAVTNPFFLLQQTIGANALTVANHNDKLPVNSIAVSGLSSSSYAGLIFWDVEVWMAPGLSVTFPDVVKQIANYRSEKYPQAQRNIDEKFITSQNMTDFTPEAALYPWTSGRFGNCTGTGPCFDYEYHLNGDIALELENYYLTSGDEQTFRNKYLPIYNSVTAAYSDLLYLNSTSNTYMLRNATDPDEYANMIDNPGYTMVLIKTRLQNANAYATRFGLPVNNTWATQASQIAIPTSGDANIILEYSSMNGSISVKQADVVLVDDFLDYQNPYTVSDLDYYAGHQSLNGPGMTFGVFSIVSATSAPTGCSAYTYDLYSSEPYTRAPWFQFSEQLNDDYSANGGTHPAYPFLTGMGGAYRVPVFGYLGLRLRPESLNINPSLPPQILHLSYRTIFWQGHAVKAVSNNTHTTLSLVPARNLPTANSAYINAVPVTVSFDTQTPLNLTSSGPLTIPNRTPWNYTTVRNNIAQCAPVVSSNTTHLPGQYPLAAVDGAISTSWRPSNPNITSTLTVDLLYSPQAGSQPFYPITGFTFDWVQNPPASYAVSFSNSSTDAGVPVWRDGDVTVSNPYDATTVDRLVRYGSNTTNVSLGSPVWSGRYAMLSLTGNRNVDGDGGGASVGEWGIVKAV